MHSLGVEHTQCRSDRDKYLTVHFENIYEDVRPNFYKLDEKENQLLVPFDFDSIMLYGPYMGSQNGQATMTANDPNQKFRDTYEKDGMSELDIKALNLLYKCEKYGSQFENDD
ncbi:Astacin-like metalloprotease toxin [Leptotrombidium deliense]|uniref:Metalloendopeptidase n=1 Tax=Leptotrombidium deliense TaxID=299467 RepID=A0A443RTC3_9ACAR|nr:Astacin-like metalloprotease toxin [Leptotrombidium deliense]